MGAQVGRRAEGCVVDIERSAVPSPSPFPFPSRPTSCQVEGMNCMGKEATQLTLPHSPGQRAPRPLPHSILVCKAQGQRLGRLFRSSNALFWAAQIDTGPQKFHPCARRRIDHGEVAMTSLSFEGEGMPAPGRGCGFRAPIPAATGPRFTTYYGLLFEGTFYESA